MSAEVVICTDCQASDCLAAQTARGWRRTDDGYCTFTSLIVHFTAIPHECCMDIQSKHSILPLTQVDSGPTVDKPHISTQSRKVQPKSLTIYHRTLGGQEWDSIRDLSVHFWNKYSEKATHTSTYNYSIKIILFLVINQCVYHSICFLSNSYYLHIIFPCWTLKVKNKENAERALTDRKLYRTELGTSTTKAKERAGWRLGADYSKKVKMQRHPGHTPDAKEAASLAPLRLLNTAYTRKRNQLLDLTHTHTHLLKQVAWFLVKQVTPGLKEPTNDLLVQVNCATRTSRSSAKGSNESLYCWWTHKPRQCCQAEITSLPIKPKSCHCWWSKSCMSNHVTCWPINIQVTSLVDPSRHSLTYQITSRLYNKSRPHYWTTSHLAFLWQTDVRPWWSTSSHLYPLTCLSAQPHQFSPS